MSSELIKFTDARDMCKSFGGTLYTLKTPEKLTILKNVSVHFIPNIWVGLHDMVTEDVFQWVDDGSIVSDSWRKVIFAPGEPNSFNGDEDCVMYSPAYSALVDSAW
ncbi:CD209 antigen-like protein 2 [Physella acuta]|uniref:CD209 antigen-like protein 2 n=1 Tax=Physella acuta TaxID=109671 RepID=UPI0027DE74FF|nr:CD209 antigen-like protein 2 [Physella acuta]